jgi:hypothetical protein
MSRHLNVKSTSNSKAELTVTCGCGTSKTFEVLTQTYRNWVGGQLIQRAFPELSNADREMLISGTCGICWDKLFKEPDDG